MKTEDYLKNLERMGDWIKSADQKVSIFLAFQGVVLIPLLPWVYENFYKSCTILPEAGIFLLLIGLGISIHTILPRMGDGKFRSLLYFRDVSSLGLGEYKKKVKDLSQDQYEDALLEQAHVLASIATRKHEEFRKAILFFSGGLTLLVVWGFMII